MTPDAAADAAPFAALARHLPRLADHPPYRAAVTAAAGAESRLDQLEAALRDAAPADRAALAGRVQLARGAKADAAAAVTAAEADARDAAAAQATAVYALAKRLAALADLDARRRLADVAAVGAEIARRGLFAPGTVTAGEWAAQVEACGDGFRAAAAGWVAQGLLDPTEPAAQWADPTA